MSQVRDFYERSDVMGADHDETAITRVEQHLLASAGVRPRRVLDLGCGAGANTLSLFGRRSEPGRPDVYGIDLSHRSVGTFRQRTGSPGIVGTGDALPMRAGSVDLVVCNDVLEHVPDTDTFTREIHRVLAPGGHLLLSTPNLAAWFNRLALLAGYQPAFSEVSYERIFGRPGADVVGHLRMFTPRALLPFLEHHHFAVVRTAAAPFAAVPAPLRPVDRLMARSLAVGAISIVLARRLAAPGT